VILDVGSTTTAIAEALTARRDPRDVTVVVNALNVVLRLEAAADGTKLGEVEVARLSP
jgi:DeoR family transcriptional regulator of aga operon